MVDSMQPSRRPSVFLACLLLLCSEPVIPQVSHSAAYQQAADSTGIAAKTKTSPADDSVLDEAPNSLDLEFLVGVAQLTELRRSRMVSTSGSNFAEIRKFYAQDFIVTTPR